MSKVAVVAHARKSLGGGLPELRQVLAREGVTDPPVKDLRIKVHPRSVTTCVPE